MFEVLRLKISTVFLKFYERTIILVNICEIRKSTIVNGNCAEIGLKGELQSQNKLVLNLRSYVY